MTTLLIIATGLSFMVGLSLIEHWRNPGPTDWWRNLQAWVIDLGIGLTILQVMPGFAGKPLLDAFAMPAWLAVAMFILLRDFTEFLYHYAQHRIPALWAMHSLHHSDPEMTALTTNRHFWGDQLVKSVTIWSGCAMVIGTRPEAMTIYGAMSLYHYVVHSKLKIDFGRFSWVLNSPAYHRRHHSRLPEHYDSNFAALFPIFDVMLGSYNRPDGWPPCGLDEGAPESFADVALWPVRKFVRRERATPLAVSEA